MTFTKDAILARLIAAYAGPGSTEEGSFAGDVLRACADSMAELWSTEIDGLERRAFVSSASGDALTAVCADRGVVRKDGEDDESLRQRTLARLQSMPASGNAEHYQAWCREAEGILHTRVIPLARGNGTVDIIAVGRDGKRPAQTVLNEAQAIVDRERPVGADARVFAATETPLHITASVKLLSDSSLSAVQTVFSQALAVFCRDIALRTDTVSYAQVLRLLLECTGVADVTALTLCGTDESLSLGERSVPVCGTIKLQEAAA